MGEIIDYIKSCGGYFIEADCGHCFRWENREEVPTYHAEADCPVCAELQQAREAQREKDCGILRSIPMTPDDICGFIDTVLAAIRQQESHENRVKQHEQPL